MKDWNITITAAQKRRELWAMLVCFVVAYLVNVVSIITFDTPWSELYTSIGYTITLAIFFYVVWLVLEIVVLALWRYFRKK